MVDYWDTTAMIITTSHGKQLHRSVCDCLLRASHPSGGADHTVAAMIVTEASRRARGCNWW